MDLYDQNLTPRIVFTIITVVLTIGPTIADFNKTHGSLSCGLASLRFLSDNDIKFNCSMDQYFKLLLSISVILLAFLVCWLCRIFFDHIIEHAII